MANPPLSPPLAPLAPPNSPPTIIIASVSASATTIREGGTFTLDATGTTTNDGSALRYSWVQVSGPPARIENATTAKATVTAAEVTSDTTAQFRLTALTTTVASQSLVNVTFTNERRMPIYNNDAYLSAYAILDVVPRAMLRVGPAAILGWSMIESGPLQYTDFRPYEGSIWMSPSQLPSLSDTTKLNSLHVPAAAAPAGHMAPHIVATDEGANRVRVFTRHYETGAIFTAADISIGSPCGVAEASEGLLVGQKNGFSLVGFGATPAVEKSLTTGRPSCVILSPWGPNSNGLFAGSGPSSRYKDVITLDEETNTLSVYRPTTTGADAEYQLTQQIPVQLNSATQLKLAAWTVSSPSISAAMALVFTDGDYGGEHRLVVVGLDENHALKQSTYAFAGAAPTNVTIDNLDEDMAFPEIVIFSPDSPQAAVFEPTSLVSNGIGPLSAPRYFEIGLGATTVLSRTHNTLQTGGSLFGFAYRRLIKVINAAP